MKKTLMALTLPALLVAQVAWADVMVKMPSNFEILATEQVRIKRATKQVALPEGDQHILVRFDSPTNPHSTAQSLGFVSSKPILVSFTAKDGEVVSLVPPRIDTQQEVKTFARQPTFKLVDANGDAVEHESSMVLFEGSPMTADYNAILADQIVSPAPVLSSTAVAGSGVAAVNAAQIDVNNLTPQQADALLRDLYKNADEKRRKDFMRWALGL
ncbi:DUF2057 domain-containing protein [Photobacterium sanguinicancri]|uniref:DUF2057 domain-containing protein n=1 Tax=Photobacterium sanguinicancri TaxID=875932 RepID=UPI0026E45ABC|nr:DUF2057 domain-containing protein [Photobacterium sanguinicancri]MDO6500093.1 DUF2057 domain-containing protein [Photobacterium sanguinicancri]